MWLIKLHQKWSKPGAALKCILHIRHFHKNILNTIILHLYLFILVFLLCDVYCFTSLLAQKVTYVEVSISCCHANCNIYLFYWTLPSIYYTSTVCFHPFSSTLSRVSRDSWLPDPHTPFQTMWVFPGHRGLREQMPEPLQLAVLEGAAALLRAPPGWLNFPPCRGNRLYLHSCPFPLELTP